VYLCTNVPTAANNLVAPSSAEAPRQRRSAVSAVTSTATRLPRPAIVAARLRSVGRFNGESSPQTSLGRPPGSCVGAITPKLPSAEPLRQKSTLRPAGCTAVVIVRVPKLGENGCPFKWVKTAMGVGWRPLPPLHKYSTTALGRTRPH